MDWTKVADFLEGEEARLLRDAPRGFPNDYATQQEMRTRASIFGTLARALREGLSTVTSDERA